MTTKSSHQPQANFSIQQQDGRYKVYDKQQRFRCSFATLALAKAYIATHECRTHAQLKRVVQAAAAPLLVLAIVMATPQPPPRPTPKPVVTCRYEKIVVWRCHNGSCRYEWGTVKTCTTKR